MVDAAKQLHVLGQLGFQGGVHSHHRGHVCNHLVGGLGDLRDLVDAGEILGGGGPIAGDQDFRFLAGLMPRCCQIGDVNGIGYLLDPARGGCHALTHRFELLLCEGIGGVPSCDLAGALPNLSIQRVDRRPGLGDLRRLRPAHDLALGAGEEVDGQCVERLPIRLERCRRSIQRGTVHATRLQ